MRDLKTILTKAARLIARNVSVTPADIRYQVQRQRESGLGSSSLKHGMYIEYFQTLEVQI